VCVVAYFIIDTVIGDIMTMISVIPIANILQNARYFEYKLASPRALRVLVELTRYIAGLHAITPYFYLTGPFYTKFVTDKVEKEEKLLTT
jgi:hypothetical protein